LHHVHVLRIDRAIAPPRELGLGGSQVALRRLGVDLRGRQRLLDEDLDRALADRRAE
jgi:hypothetical protein